MQIFVSLPNSFDEDKSILQSLFRVFKLVKNRSDVKVYYDEDDVHQFKNLNEETDVYIEDNLKSLRIILSSPKFRKISYVPNEVSYVQWLSSTYQTFNANNLISSIASNIFLNSSFVHCLFNIQDSLQTCRRHVLVFRDAKHLNFPDRFVRIDCVTTIEELDVFLRTNHIIDFSLRDEERFIKMNNKFVKGAPLYLEIETNRYWHLDTFHNYIEYEVYNPSGIHVGVADQNGKINFDKSVPGRSVNP